MSAKILPIFLFMFLLIGCQVEQSPTVNDAGVSTTPTVFDTVPVSYDLFLPAVLEDNQSGWIYLSYTDAENHPAVSCNIFNRSYLTETVPCTCSFGICYTKVTPSSNYTGTASFKYSVTANNLTSEPSTAIFTVVAVAEAPTANERVVSLDENTTYTSDGTISYPNLSGSDPDGDSLTCIKVTDPINGAVTVNPDCSFSYTPVANYEGSDSFTFKVFDGTYDSPAETVSLSVLHVNEVPVANNSSFTTYQNTSGLITFSFVDSDASDPFEAMIITNPSNGTLSGSGITRTYTPNTNFIGTDSFTFMIYDGLANSNVATVNITVLTPTIYLRTTGNDATGAINDSTLPFLTAQAAVDAAIAFNANPITPLIIDVGAGSFGNVTLTTNFPGSITWTGAGAGSSIIGDISANGTNGAAGVASGDPTLGDYDGAPGTNGLTVTIVSDFTVTFGNVSTNGGNGGLQAIDPDARPGDPGIGGILNLTGIFGNLSALGGSGHGGGAGGTITLVGNSTATGIDASGGGDLCVLAQSCITSQNSGNGGAVDIQNTAIVNGNVTSNGGDNNGDASARMTAGSGGNIIVSGTVNGAVTSNGGNTYDSDVGNGGLVTVNPTGVVTGNITALSGIYSNNGTFSDAGTVTINGSAQDIYAHSNNISGGEAGEVNVNGTANDIYLYSSSSSCTSGVAGEAVIFPGATVANIYAYGGNAACDSQGIVSVRGTVTGTVSVDGGDTNSTDDAGVAGEVEILAGANVNIISALGGDAAATTCKDGGNGGTISVSAGATYNPANFFVSGGNGDTGCGNVNGSNGTITVVP